MAVKAIPDGYRTVTPSLTIKGAAKLIEFIEAAFGGKEVFRMPAPSREIMHAEITMGDLLIMLNDAIGQSPTTAPLFLYVNDVIACTRAQLRRVEVRYRSRPKCSGRPRCTGKELVRQFVVGRDTQRGCAAPAD